MLDGYIINIKVKMLASLFLIWIILFSSTGYCFDRNVSHDLFVEAYVPDLIEVSGLPEKIDVTWHDGRLQSPSLNFEVRRSFASLENPQPYFIRLKSSEGEHGNEFYLSHTRNRDERLFLNVQFKDSEEVRFSRYFSADKPLAGTTTKNINGFENEGGRKPSLVIFNNDEAYLAQKMPGKYAAVFTVMVTAM